MEGNGGRGLIETGQVLAQTTQDGGSLLHLEGHPDPGYDLDVTALRAQAVRALPS